VTDQWAFAVSADNDDTKASKAKKLQQASGVDGNFQLKAKDNAWGYRLATMFKLNKKHQFGLMYRSKIAHTYEGKAYLNDLDGSSTFGAGVGYSTIFGTSYETRLSEKFTLPQSVVIGYSFKPSEKWTFNFDLEWMDWSSVKHDAINWLDETDATRLSILNGGNPEARDWKSAFSQAIGVEYAASERLRLRGGYYHHKTPIPQSTFHANLPDADSHGFTSGLGYDLTPKVTIDLAYSALVYEARKVDSDINAAIDGKYRQFTNIAMGTVTYKF
jgi:long-chain fatty acid transport protein